MKSADSVNDDGLQAPDRDAGEPLLVHWADSEWFQIWLKLARHENDEAPSAAN